MPPEFTRREILLALAVWGLIGSVVMALMTVLMEFFIRPIYGSVIRPWLAETPFGPFLFSITLVLVAMWVIVQYLQEPATRGLL